MGHPRIQTTHQHSRIESSPSGHSVLSDVTSKDSTTYCSADGQLYSSSVCQQERGDTVVDVSSLGSGNLERLSTERHMDNSTTSSRSTQCRCGLGFTSLQQTHGVDSGQGDLYTHSHQVLHSASRLVCVSFKSSTTLLCFPTPRPGCNGDRCDDVAVEQMDIIHSCTDCDAASNSEEDTRGSGNLSTNSSKMARPVLVSVTTGDVSGHPCHSSNVGEESVSTVRPGSVTPIVENNEASGMASFREPCRAEGLPPQVCDILMASWREGTKKGYEGPWKLWTSWCVSRTQCPFSATVAEVLEFLTEQFHTRKLSYRTVGVYKSCISQLHDPIEGQPLGTLPLLSRFMKGIFELRPPLPKICSTWSVGTLLEHIKNLPSNESLSLKELTFKTTILLALTSSARAHELAALNLDYIS